MCCTFIHWTLMQLLIKGFIGNLSHVLCGRVFVVHSSKYRFIFYWLYWERKPIAMLVSKICTTLRPEILRCMPPHPPRFLQPACLAGFLVGWPRVSNWLSQRCSRSSSQPADRPPPPPLCVSRRTRFRTLLFRCFCSSHCPSSSSSEECRMNPNLHTSDFISSPRLGLDGRTRLLLWSVPPSSSWKSVNRLYFSWMNSS